MLTSSALGSSYDIATATTVMTGTSSWAMKLATSGSSYLPVIVGSTGDLEKESSTPDFSNYVAVPTEYTRVAYRNSATDVGTGALGSSLTTTYRVYVSPVQPAGTYIGQVKYTLVHPSTAAPATGDCQPSGTTISTILCMQDINSSNKSTILASMVEGQPYLLKDSRDDEEYFVAKLADGKVWMLDNLRLGGDEAIILTNEDSNIASATWTLPASSNTFSGVVTTPKADIAISPNGSVARLAFVQELSEESVSFKLTAADPETCGRNNIDCSFPFHYAGNKSVVVTHSGLGTGKTGVYYTYCAASAGTVCTEGTNTNDHDATGDVCPIGWRLPTGGSTGEFANLIDSYNSVGDFKSGFSFTMSGVMSPAGAGLVNVDLEGLFWASTYGFSGQEGMGTLYGYDNLVGSGSALRSIGIPIRCVVGN